MTLTFVAKAEVKSQVKISYSITYCV